MKPLGQQDKKKKNVNLKMKRAKGVGGGVMNKSPECQGSCQKALQDYAHSKNALS